MINVFYLKEEMSFNLISTPLRDVEVKKLPINIRQLFWTHIKHWKKIIVAAFVYVNGLNQETLLDWVRLMHLCRDYTAYKHLDISII